MLDPLKNKSVKMGLDRIIGALFMGNHLMIWQLAMAIHIFASTWVMACFNGKISNQSVIIKEYVAVSINICTWLHRVHLNIQAHLSPYMAGVVCFFILCFCATVYKKWPKKVFTNIYNRLCKVTDKRKNQIQHMKLHHFSYITQSKLQHILWG